MRIGLVPQVIISGLFPERSVPYVPLGLLSLAGAVDRARHTVEIVDLTMAVRDRQIPYDAHFEEAAARLLLAGGYDVVGFSTFSSTYHHTLRIAEELKALSPATTVVFGGPQASFTWRETMDAFPVDLVVRGEGEETLPELLAALEDGRSPHDVRGLAFRDGEGVTSTPDRPLLADLDALPMPAWDLYPLARHPKAPVEVTRGCPYRCTYCATSRYWQRKVRRKSIERVWSEVRVLQDRYAVQYVSFADDTFTLDRKWALELCNQLVARRFRTRWLCSTRVDAVDDALLAAMARAGCANIFYGIESGSERIQRQIQKEVKVGMVVDSLRRTASHGITVTASFMIGFPEETEDDLSRTLRLRNRIQQLFPSKQAIQTHVLSPDVDTAMTLAHADRLRYDGYHSDQSGGALARFDRTLIQAHPTLFLAYHYIETTHLDREFVKRLHAFLSATQVVCYWSSLYLMLRDGEPLKLVKAWMAAFEEDPAVEGVAPDAPLHLRAVSSAARFFADLFARDGTVPPSVRELFAHEYELMRVKGGLAVDPGMQREAALNRPLSSRVLGYDPRETIALIREDHRKVAQQQRRPTKVDYVQRQGGG